MWTRASARFRAGRRRPLPFPRIKLRFNRIDHHRGQRDFLIEGVLPNALVKIDREVDRGLASGDSTDHDHLRTLPPRSARTSRGSIVHHLPGGIRLRESAGSIELLGEPRDEALEQLVTVAQQRFGTKRVTLLGTRGAQKRMAQLAEERGLEITGERER